MKRRPAPAAIRRRLARVRLLAFDVDGVLTDGTLLVHPDGGESKAFHVRDGLGIVLAQAAGLRTGLLSGRQSGAVAGRARALGMSVVAQGVKDKKTALDGILAREGLLGHEVAYVGDDLNDLEVMAAVGLSAAPGDAAFEVKAEAFMVLEARGGQGCLREFIEAILRARGDWEQALRAAGAGP